MFVDCLDINDTELGDELFSNELNDINNCVFVLYDISEKNIGFFRKIKTSLVNKGFPLIIASLREDEIKSPLGEELRTMFLVVDALKSATEIAGPEGGLDENEDAKRTAALSQSKSQGILKDKILTETKWSDIDMFLTDKEYKTLDISIKKGKAFTVNCRELGLESNHSHKPLKAWYVLMAFAKAENNVIPSTGKSLSAFAVSVNNMVPSNGKALFTHINILRGALKKSFGISEDPIPHSEEKKAYETLFRINDKSYAEEYRKSTQKMENVECIECSELIIKCTHNNLDHAGNFICDTCKGASHDRLSNENTYNDYPDKDE